MVLAKDLAAKLGLFFVTYPRTTLTWESGAVNPTQQSARMVKEKQEIV